MTPNLHRMSGLCINFSDSFQSTKNIKMVSAMAQDELQWKSDVEDQACEVGIQF